MRFGYTILYVQDVARSVAFYAAAFGLASRFIAEGGQYAELATGDTTLAFASNEQGHSVVPSGFRQNDPNDLPAGIEIALVAGDVAAAYATALQAGASAVSEPGQKPWGQTVAYVRDLDGVLIELASEM